MKDPIEDIDFLYKVRNDWNFYVDDEISKEYWSIQDYIYDKHLKNMEA